MRLDQATCGAVEYVLGSLVLVLCRCLPLCPNVDPNSERISRRMRRAR